MKLAVGYKCEHASKNENFVGQGIEKCARPSGALTTSQPAIHEVGHADDEPHGKRAPRRIAGGYQEHKNGCSENASYRYEIRWSCQRCRSVGGDVVVAGVLHWRIPPNSASRSRPSAPVTYTL